MTRDVISGLGPRSSEPAGAVAQATEGDQTERRRQPEPELLSGNRGTRAARATGSGDAAGQAAETGDLGRVADGQRL